MKISGYFGENKGVILVVIFVKIRGYFNENNQVQLQHSMLWWQSRHVLVQRQRQQKKPGLQQQLPVVGSVAEDSFGSCLPSLQLVLCNGFLIPMLFYFAKTEVTDSACLHTLTRGDDKRTLFPLSLIP